MSDPVILSRPPVGPPVPEDQWAGVSLVWIGADGSVWDIGTGGRGAVLQRSGTEGLHNPVITKFNSTSRVIPGNRPRGWRTEAREVFWPILVYSRENSAQWKSRYQEFFASIHPEIPGTWRVSHGGVTRELQLTGVFKNGHAFEHDPLIFGWEMFGVPLEAHQPYWEGAPLELGPWRQPETGPFFAPGGSPDFFISSSTEIGRALITNPGDVDAWLVWKAVGPLSEIEIGIGDAVATIPFDLAPGQELIIDTDPRHQTGTLNGLDVTKPLGLLPYAAIPPGSNVEVHVEAAGDGEISATLTPLYFRAM